MTPKEEPPTDRYVRPLEAGRLTGLPRRTLAGLADRGVPGGRPAPRVRPPLPPGGPGGPDGRLRHHRAGLNRTPRPGIDRGVAVTGP